MFYRSLEGFQKKQSNSLFLLFLINQKATKMNATQPQFPQASLFIRGLLAGIVLGAIFLVVIARSFQQAECRKTMATKLEWLS